MINRTSIYIMQLTCASLHRHLVGRRGVLGNRVGERRAEVGGLKVGGRNDLTLDDPEINAEGYRSKCQSSEQHM